MDELTALQPQANLQSLTDRQLVNALTTLAAFERASIARLVQTLAEFDRRRLYLPLGFTSLFAYCTNRLHMSQDEAFYRIEAARVARRYPVVLDYLGKGAITLRTARMLGPHLTDDNHRQLLEAATHQKRPEVDILLARLRPKPDVPPTIRKLPDVVSRASDVSTDRTETAGSDENPAVNVRASAPQTVSSKAQAGVGESLTSSSVRLSLSTAIRGRDSHVPRDIPARRPIVAPLSDTSYRLQITMGAATHAALREIQSLVRHSIRTAILRPSSLARSSSFLRTSESAGRPRP